MAFLSTLCLTLIFAIKCEENGLIELKHSAEPLTEPIDTDDLSDMLKLPNLDGTTPILEPIDVELPSDLDDAEYESISNPINSESITEYTKKDGMAEMSPDRLQLIKESVSFRDYSFSDKDDESQQVVTSPVSTENAVITNTVVKNTVTEGSVTSDMDSDGSITTNMVTESSVSTAVVTKDSVTTNMFTEDSVTTMAVTESTANTDAVTEASTMNTTANEFETVESQAFNETVELFNETSFLFNKNLSSNVTSDLDYLNESDSLSNNTILPTQSSQPIVESADFILTIVVASLALTYIGYMLLAYAVCPRFRRPLPPERVTMSNIQNNNET